MKSPWRSSLLLAATAIAVYLCYRLVEPFLPALAWAAALGGRRGPDVRRLGDRGRRARVRRRTGKALAVGAAGALLIALVANVLYPALVGQRLRLHPLAAFFALVGGLLLFGPSGLILGPAVLAVTDALVHIWRRRTAGGRPAESGLASAA